MCTSFRLRVPARRALHPATPSTGQFPHQSTRILPARPRLTHLRTHSWAWAGTFRRPSLRVTQRHYSGLSLLLEAAQDPTLNCFCLFVCLTAKGPRRNLRNDLLIAADSITNTMSSLVKELNSGKDEWRENSSHIQTYYTLTVFIIFFFNKQRVEVKRRALWIQILDVNYWPQTPQILSTLTNQGTFKILQKQPCY